MEETVLSAFAPKLPHRPRGKGSLNLGTHCLQRDGISYFAHSSSLGASDGSAGGRRGWLLPSWMAVPSLSLPHLRAALDMPENLILKRKKKKKRKKFSIDQSKE